MKEIKDTNFGQWLKKNKYIIVVDETSKESKKMMNRFGDNATLISLPIVSKNKLKNVKNIKTPNVFKLNNKGRYEMVNGHLSTPNRRLNKLYKEYTSMASFFGNIKMPLKNWNDFSKTLGNNRAGNAIPCKDNDWLFVNFGSATDASFYTKRGKNGFDQLPKSIYTKKGNNPYGGKKAGWRPPRPNGPRDQELMKGLNFGMMLNHPPLFRPHQVKNWNPGKTTYANKSLYLPGCGPYQKKRNSKFGQYKDLYTISGPNDVAYRKAFLMYKGAGSNTVNWSTKKQFLPPYTAGKKITRVQKNNNPTGWLSRHGTIYTVDNIIGSGPRRINQPEKLHKSQSKDKRTPKLTEETGLNPRSYLGGYGRKKNKKTLNEGDTIIISKKGVKIKKNKKLKKN